FLWPQKFCGISVTGDSRLWNLTTSRLSPTGFETTVTPLADYQTSKSLPSGCHRRGVIHQGSPTKEHFMETISSWTLAALERHGWWQNPDVGGSPGKNESGSRCVVQALVDAASEMSRAIPSATGRHHVALALITEGEIGLMRKLGAKTLSDVFHWN